MRAFAAKAKTAAQHFGSAKSAGRSRPFFRQVSPSHLEHAPFSYDFSRVARQARGEVAAPGESSRLGLIGGKDPNRGSTPKDAGVPSPPPRSEGTPAKKKKAGLDSFVVKWTKNPVSGPTIAKLRLDYSAKFKKDDAHDPALADFRQNASFDFAVTDGPHKGQKQNQRWGDDHYTRADDTAKNTYSDVDFVSADNPGSSTDSPLKADDVIDFTFTAEQMIIDVSDNTVLKKHGPHTATIKGKHERAFDGVPETYE